MCDRMILRLLTSTLILLLGAGSIYAEIPQLINYQGQLTNSEGSPVTTGAYLIGFTIYGSDTGTDVLWESGYQTVQVADGLFDYQLGSAVPLPDDLFVTSGSRYLGIKVGADPEISPRTRIVSAAYAYHALRSDTAAYSMNSGGNFVQKAGDTMSGSLYFDDDGKGPVAELLVYDDLSIMKFYQSGTEAIKLESEFATVTLRSPDDDLSVWISGGEDVEYDGGSVRIYDPKGATMITLDGGRSGDASVSLPDNAVNSDELSNEPGIAVETSTETQYLTGFDAYTLTSVTITTPGPGYITVQANATGFYGWTDTSVVGWAQIVETPIGGLRNPYATFFGVNNRAEVDGLDYTPISRQRVFYKDVAGTHTFYMEAGRLDYSDTLAHLAVREPVLIATYYPTSYGAVSTVVGHDEAGAFDSALPVSLSSEGTAVDQNDASLVKVDLRELELKAKQKRIEALEAELELRRAQEMQE